MAELFFARLINAKKEVEHAIKFRKTNANNMLKPLQFVKFLTHKKMYEYILILRLWVGVKF